MTLAGGRDAWVKSPYQTYGEAEPWAQSVGLDGSATPQKTVGSREREGRAVGP